MASRRCFNSKHNYIYPSPGSFDPVATGSHFEFDEVDVYSLNEFSQLETKKSVHTSRSKKNLTKMDKAGRSDKETSASLPVNVPDWSKILNENCSRNHQNRENCDDEDSDSDEEGRIPPHEYLARARGASVSVHEGIGRTLKGRDLRRVRNAIWQKTGFED